MKQQLLYLGGCIWLILLFDSFIYKIMMFFLLCYLFNHRKKGNIKLFMISFATITLFTMPQHQSIPSSKVIHIEKIKMNYCIGKVENQSVIIYGLNQVSFDDVIKVEGEFEEVHSLSNFYGFDFKEWLNQDHIHYQIKVKKYHHLKYSNRISSKIFRKVQTIKDKRRKDYILSHLYGIKEKEEDSNLDYFITASGLHIALLGTLLYRLLLRFVSKRKASYLSLFLIFLLGYLTVFSYSLIRIIIFRSISLFFGNHQKDKLGLSMIVWCLLFPTHILELSFILPVLFRLLDLFDQQKRSRFVKQMIILIPIQLIYFYECNLIQIILFPIYRYLFLIFYIFASLILWIPSMSFGIGVMIFLENILLKISLPSIRLIGLPSIIWLYYWLKLSLNIMIKINKKQITTFILLLLWQQYAHIFQPYYEVMFIDVGQGDSALISLPFNQGVMMIDVCGNLYKNIPNDVILPILKGKGIERINLVILTHDDYDHSGGLPQLKKLIKIDEVITKKRAFIDLGKLRFHVLLHEITLSDQNENSIVLYTNILNNKFLFTGDAGVPFEKLMMNKYPKLDIDILKVGHHGSNSASSSLFIQQLSPTIASISSGYHNRYHHPHRDTIRNLKKHHAYISNTADDGAIRIRIFPFFSIIETSNHNISFHLND
ncbi:MAG: MBL fold metallo-hydrolase [Erysipelotrichaceae bacterium]